MTLETNPAKLWEIRTMYLCGHSEDKDVAIQSLKQLIGEKDAIANTFLLEFYKDWDDDSDVVIDENNFHKMVFKTYPISFGKDYRYSVLMIAKFQGKEIVNTLCDYSRYQVGNGDPKHDFCQLICDALRKDGYIFYSGLFANFNKLQNL